MVGEERCRAGEGRQVVLVSMPFNVCVMPPIGICGLKAVLDRAGVSARVRHFNLEFLPEFSVDLDVAQTLHDEISYLWDFLPGEWVFSPPADPVTDAAFLHALRHQAHVREPILKVLARLRARAAGFIEHCAQRIVADAPAVVGFTTSFMQTQASVSLARAVRRLSPDVKIVLGGSNAFGEMGPALLEQYDVLDVVVRGEAELSIAPLIEALAKDDEAALANIPGLAFRRGGATAVTCEATAEIAMDDVPVPDFSDYFSTLRELRRFHRGGAGLPHFLPIETSRGCWWGERSHCTFCGLNADRMRFRSRSPEAAYAYIDEIRRRYGVTRLFAVDNIIDHKYYDTVLEKLAASGEEYFIHFEIKSNLKRHHVRQLDRSGVRKVQPGIESLSTPILQLMRKGVSALQNIQTLKWLTEADIQTSWYLLYGFPGETIEPYREMAQLIGRLTHIRPPGELAPVYIERFSPYQTRPASFGIEITGPTDWYRMAFPEAPAERLTRLAYRFDFREPGRDPALDILISEELGPAVRAWKTAFARSGPTLHVVHGPLESVVVTGPLMSPDRLIRLDGTLRTILLNSDSATPRHALMRLPEETEGPPRVGEDLYARFLTEWPGARDERGLGLALEPQAALDLLEGQGLVISEGGASLALPLVCSPERLARLRPTRRLDHVRA